MKKISLKYEGKCVNCGRAIRAGETAYWEKDRGVWHVDCDMFREAKAHTSRSLWAITAGSVTVAFILGGLVLGPALPREVSGL